MSNVSVPPLYDGAVQQFHIKDSQVSVDALNHNAVRFIMAATTLGFNSSIALVSNHNGTNYANNYPRGTIFSGSVLGGGYAGTWIALIHANSDVFRRGKAGDERTKPRDVFGTVCRQNIGHIGIAHLRPQIT